jgi:iron complex outermembrane receptor protein
MLNVKLLRLPVALLCAINVCAAATANAQTANSADAESDDLFEVIVTSQRRQESLQRVPSAITAVTSEMIEKSNIRGIEQILAQAPNVSFVSNGSRDRKDISIRGVSNQLDPYLDVRPAAYAIYIDEFNVTEGTSNPQVLDLERIEVLRGPQGTYFGRNSTAGAINVTTKRPTNDFGWEASVGASSFSTQTASAIVNVPVVDDKFAFRLSAQKEKSDGNVKNVNAIGGGNDTDYTAARIVGRLTPNEYFSNDTVFSVSRERNGMRAGVPSGYLTATWRNVYYQNRPGNIADPDGVGFFPNNTDLTNFNRPQSVGTDFYYVSNRSVLNFDDVSVTAVVGYLSSEVFNKGDVDGGSRDLFYETGVLDHTSTSGELRLQSTGEQRLEWSLGTTIGKDTGSTWQETRSGAARPLNRIPDTVGNRTESKGSNKSFALFGQGTFHFTDALAGSIGVRYTKDKINGALRRFGLGGVVVTDDTNRSKTFGDFSPRFNLTYTPSDNLMLYATASKGYKSGGVQTLQLLTTLFYNPEHLKNYEAGIKFTSLGGRLRGDFSAFRNDWTDVQQQTRFQVIDAMGAITPVTGINNAAGAESEGVDGSIDFKATANLSLHAHVGYVTGKFTSWPNALIDGQFVNATGRPLVNAPKWTGGVSGEYRRTVFGDFEGFIRPEYRLRSEKLSSVLGIRYFEYPFISPGYSVYNLRAGIDNGKWSVTAYAENLTDKKYYENVYEKAFYSGVQLEPSYRNIGITVRYKGWGN